MFFCLFLTIYEWDKVRLWLFSGDEYCSDAAPVVHLLTQGGGNDSTAESERRRIRRVTQMVRFALFKLREA